MCWQKRWCRTLVVAFIFLYVGSYFAWSRLASAVARNAGTDGFFFVLPRGTLTRYANRACIIFYLPLITLEDIFGTGSGIASEPIEELSDLKGKTDWRAGEDLGGNRNWHETGDGSVRMAAFAFFALEALVYVRNGMGEM